VAQPLPWPISASPPAPLSSPLSPPGPLAPALSSWARARHAAQLPVPPRASLPPLVGQRARGPAFSPRQPSSRQPLGPARASAARPSQCPAALPRVARTQTLARAWSAAAAAAQSGPRVRELARAVFLPKTVLRIPLAHNVSKIELPTIPVQFLAHQRFSSPRPRSLRPLRRRSAAVVAVCALAALAAQRVSPSRRRRNHVPLRPSSCTPPR
jgi:hypothetical protein